MRIYGLSHGMLEQTCSYDLHKIDDELAVNKSSAKEHFANLSIDEQITVALYVRNCPDDPRRTACSNVT